MKKEDSKKTWKLGLRLGLVQVEKLSLIPEEYKFAGDMELLESGKAAKYYMLNSFDLQLNEELISRLEPTLTLKKIKKMED